MIWVEKVLGESQWYVQFSKESLLLFLGEWGREEVGAFKPFPQVPNPTQRPSCLPACLRSIAISHM